MATFDERETSQHGGQPVEGFRFVQGETVWLFTSADREVLLPIGRFDPETIGRDQIQQTKEDTGEQLRVTVPITNPVAALFIGDVPSSPVWLTVYRAHRGDESEAITVFVGKIVRAEFAESDATLVGTSVAAHLLRAVPPLHMQTPCNHILFSAECGANPTACRDLVSITTVDGPIVTSNDFALQPDQWFRGGRLQSLAGEVRFIADHVGDTIELMSAMPGLASLDTAYAYWGCDHLEATCASKFDRLDNHLGFSRLPTRNPFEGRIA